MFSELAPRRDLQATGNSVLRDAPSNWAIRPMRSLIKSRSERNRTDLPLLSVARERGVFVRSSNDDNHNVIPEDLTNYKVARLGDLVINKMKAWQGSLGLSPEDGIVSPAYYVYDFSIENRHFGQALLRSKPYVALLGAASDGVRIGQWDLSVQRFRELPVLIPPADEQAAIVKYLGHAHARIDRAIAAKRNLIALLEEQKQAIIHRAVTRGLDSTVPLKDSGIPWLGEIPAHWSVRKLFRAFALQGSGTTPPQENQYGGGIPWIMSGDLNNGAVSTTKRTVTTAALASLASLKLYDPHSLVIAMYGATIGKTGITAMVAATNQACCVFSKPRVGTDVEYVQLAMMIGRPALVEQGYGGGQPNVNAETVRQFKVPMPPGPEQTAIAGFCRVESNRVAALVGRAAREIELFREFRTRLTSDVVTGQVDVREIAATLPERTDDMLASSTGATVDTDLQHVDDFTEGEED